jgi:putative FmdB family regulatory protein
MPIYEFRCDACRKTFEKIVLSGDAPASAACPKCGRKGAERLASRFATASKGGGDEWGSDFGGDDGDDGGGADDWGGDGGDFGGDGGDDGGDSD